MCKSRYYIDPAAGDDANDGWSPERPSVWRYTRVLASEVCNLVFNDGDSCGHLRWRPEELRRAGEWHYTGIGATSAGESGNAGPAGGVLVRENQHVAESADEIHRREFGRQENE
jgi:hypothetical protein